MGRADLQLHSDLGDGLSSLDAILDSAEQVGLDVIALTDHDDIHGAFALRDLAARRSSPVQVITGVEDFFDRRQTVAQIAVKLEICLTQGDPTPARTPTTARGAP